jgi:hypothetical protein
METTLIPVAVLVVAVLAALSPGMALTERPTQVAVVAAQAQIPHTPLLAVLVVLVS